MIDNLSLSLSRLKKRVSRAPGYAISDVRSIVRSFSDFFGYIVDELVQEEEEQENYLSLTESVIQVWGSLKDDPQLLRKAAVSSWHYLSEDNSFRFNLLLRLCNEILEDTFPSELRDNLNGGIQLSLKNLYKELSDKDSSPITILKSDSHRQVHSFADSVAALCIPIHQGICDVLNLDRYNFESDNSNLPQHKAYYIFIAGLAAVSSLEISPSALRSSMVKSFESYVQTMQRIHLEQSYRG